MPCGDEYPSCKFIKNAHVSKKEIKSIEAELKVLEGSIFEYQGLIENLIKEGIEEKINKYNDVLSKEYRYQVDQKAIFSKIESVETKIESNLQNIQKFRDLTLELKDFNSEDLIEKEKLLQTELKENSEKLSYNKHDLFKNQKLIFVLEEEILSLQKEKKEYAKLNEEYKIHDLFSLAVSKKVFQQCL